MRAEHRRRAEIMNSLRRSLSSLVLLAMLGSSTIGTAQVGANETLPDGKKSDGCTLIPDGHIRPCCLIHDQDYFRGGTRSERREADKKLFDCVRETKGVQHRIFAPFVWLGVRVGGVPFLSTSFRWGFGTNEKGYSRKAEETVDKNRP